MRPLTAFAVLVTLGSLPLADAARAADTAGWTIALAARDVLTSSSRTMLATSLTDEWTGSDWDWVDRNPPPHSTGRKSACKAVAASALLPGLGEQYLGAAKRAKVFYATEGLEISADFVPGVRII